MKQEEDDAFWSGVGDTLRPRLSEAHWTAQRNRILSRLAPEESVSAFAGWWKVPALTLASCAVYVRCVETSLLPQPTSEPPAAASSSAGVVTLSTILSDGQEPSEGHLLTMILEGD